MDKAVRYNERVLRLKEVMRRTGFSRSTIYQYQKEERFPQSIKLGTRIVGWLESDVEHWLEKRVSISRPLSSDQ